MERLFAWEGKFFRIMGKAADLMVLNLFWIIGSLPVITAGAATTALFSVTMEMAGNSEEYIRKDYWKKFIKNMKHATISWLFFLSVHLIVMITCVFHHVENIPGARWIKICLWITEILLFMSFSYVFPLLAFREAEDLVVLWKQAFAVCTANLPWSIVLIAGEGLLVFTVCRYPLQSVPVWLFMGVAVYAYVTSFVYLHVFHRSAGLLRDK